MYNPYSIGNITNNSYSYNYIKRNNFNIIYLHIMQIIQTDINPIINLNIKRNENI